VAFGVRTALDSVLQVRDQWRYGSVEINNKGVSWVAIYPQFINPSPPILADVRMRRALLYGLDRQELVDTLMVGMTAVAHNVVRPSEPDYEAVLPSVIRYEYEPARATQMLNELGYAKGPDGMFRDPAGQPFLVQAWATDQTPIQPKSLTSVADYWRRLGVGVEENVVPNQRVADREYRNTRPAFEVLSSSAGSFSSFHTSQIALPENNFVGNNRPRYSDAELDSMIDRYFRTIPRGERVEILKRIVHQLTDQVVAMGLFYNISHGFIGNRLVNVHARGAYNTEAWNAQEWELR